MSPAIDPRPCDNCGNDYPPTRADQRWCSDSCRTEGRAKAKAAAKAAAQSNEPDESVEAPDWAVTSEDKISSSSSSNSFGRPELDEGALYGLPGEVVQTIAPHTEGDPAALLLSYLTMLGNAAGPQPSVHRGRPSSRPPVHPHRG